MEYKTSRKEAIAAGETRYLGPPCKRGHDGIRNTCDRGCVVCSNEKAKAYNARNKSKKAKYRKSWYLKNQERAKAYSKEYRLNNSEKVKDTQKEYRLKNAEQLKDYHKRYKLENRDKASALESKRRAAKLNRTPSWLRPVDLRHIQVYYEISKRQTQATGIKHHVDHVIPLQGETVSGLHVPWNLQVLEGRENSKKHNKLL